MEATNNAETSPFKFSPGQIFTLTPKARIQWLAFSNSDGSCVRAVRCDSAHGKALLEWMGTGANQGQKPFSYYELCSSLREFWPDHLTGAVLVRENPNEARSKQ